MGKSAPSAPAAPDPAATSAAQTASNKETALYNFGLNNPTYNTPLGNINYTVDTSDPNQPKSTANVTLSPEQQQLYDQQSQQSIGLSNLANQLQGRVGDTLSQPGPSEGDINTLAQNAQDAYYRKQTQYLDPQFEKQGNQLNAGLANQGVVQGSEAYKNAQNELGLQKQQAYSNAQDSAITNGTNNAQQLFALNSAERQAPLNEFNALRTGSQVQMPQFQGTNTSSAAPTNVSGNINQGYQNQLGLYNSQTASNNAQTQGLYSLGGTLGAAGIMAFSDRRLKTNIRLIGKTPGGVPVYEYFYKTGGKKQIGVMAQDLEKIVPEAVITMPNGYKAVNYAMVV